MKPARDKKPVPNQCRQLLTSELEIAVYAGRIEITERYSAAQARQLIELLRRYGVECELVFHSPCG